MTKTVLSIFSGLFLIGCVSTLREPAALTSGLIPFPGQVTKANCQSALSNFQQGLDQLQSQVTKLQANERQIENFENQSFSFRQKAVASGLPENCILQLRKINTTLRSIRDFIAERIYEKSSSHALSFQLKETPLTNFAYQTGDVLLTRGNSFLSATISKVATNENHYSHIAYIYVDPTTKKVFTLESYPNKGAKIYPIAEALVNENLRILLLRPKDRQKAAAAATHMYLKISKAIEDGRPIKYDYAYNELDSTRLSCVEVVQEAYLQLFNEKIPSLPSQAILQDKDFRKSTGVHSGPFVVPADFETDPRFEVQWEWTDFKQTADQRIKDAILQKLFQWMKEEKYVLQGNLKSLSTKMFLSLRSEPAVWNLISEKMNVKGIPLEIPSEILVTMVKSNDIGRILMGEMNFEDQEMLKKSGRHLTEKELSERLEKLRIEDRENFLSSKPAPLHQLFRPWSLKYNSAQ